MDNVIGSSFDDDNNRDGKGSSEVLDNAKKVYKVARKIIDAARWLFNFLPGGVFTLGVLVITALIALAFFSIVFGLMSPIPGGSLPSLPDSTEPVETIEGLKLELIGPNKIANSDDIEYTVNVIYDATIAKVPLSDIVVYEILPENTSFVSAQGAYTFNNGRVEWPMAQNSNSFTFTLKPTMPDIKIFNKVYAKNIGSSSSSGSSSGSRPASLTETCEGKYTLDNPLGANFGDPSCSFKSPDQLHALLQQLDPGNADYWFFQIAYCETRGTYDPNAVNRASTSGSAWGLFQMGHEAYPALNIPRQMGDDYDRGDVDWETQTSNAINHNHLRHDDFSYWDCS